MTTTMMTAAAGVGPMTTITAGVAGAGGAMTTMTIDRRG